MSGYTPVFDSVFTGTLCGKYPDTAAWLFFLAMADHQGHVDRTPEYISAVTGMPLDDLKACISRLMSPDPGSRSMAEEGRRLVPIDPERSWGWRIVNIGIYRKKAANRNQSDTGANADRMRQRREAMKEQKGPAETSREQIGPAATSGDRDSNSNSDTNRESKRRKRHPLPEDFSLTPELSRFLAEKIPDADPAGVVEQFRDLAQSKGWQYVNWASAFKVYVKQAAPGSGHWSSGQYPRKGTGGRRWE